MFRTEEGAVERLEDHINHVFPFASNRGVRPVLHINMRLESTLIVDGRRESLYMGILLDDSVTDIRVVLKSFKELCGQIVANEIEYGRD